MTVLLLLLLSYIIFRGADRVLMIGGFGGQQEHREVRPTSPAFLPPLRSLIPAPPTLLPFPKLLVETQVRGGPLAAGSRMVAAVAVARIGANNIKHTKETTINKQELNIHNK